MREEIKSFPGIPAPQPPFYVQMTGTSYCDGTYRIARSCSEIYCVEYIISGSGTVETPAGTFHPCAGDTYLLHLGDRHLYYSDASNPWTKIWINFCGSLVKPMLESYALADSFYFPSADTGGFIRRIQRIAWSGAGDSEIMERCSLILHELFQFLSGTRMNSGPAISENARLMKEYLDSHISEKISLSSLRPVTYLSVSQMIRVFKEAYGETPYEYYIARRIETARLLLRNTTVPIREIAERTGFSDEHYFSGFFKEKCGIPPKEYRQRG